MVQAWEDGRLEKARELFFDLMPLCQAMFYETNPVPVKTAAGLMGKCTGEMRLPLVSMSPGNLDRLKKVLQDYDLI